MATGAAGGAERKLETRILLDLLIFILLVIPIIVCEFGIEPTRRGFFCNDETINYLFHGNTITPVMLGLLVGLLPQLIVIVIEFLRFYRRGELGASIAVFGWNMPTWLAECVQQIAYFAFGLVLTLDATEVGKYTIGRLRPHFMDVCQPQLRDGSTCADPQNQYRYVENYVCLSNGFTADQVRQARLSFPSGHSSLAFYAMVYIALYMQYKISWRSSGLARHFLQFTLIMLAWYTALSRITDNWHHWSDVLFGSLLGIIGALVTARYVSNMFQQPHKLELKLSPPREDTTTTLQEAISTPPPYSLNSLNTMPSFSNEEYCTKV